MKRGRPLNLGQLVAKEISAPFLVREQIARSVGFNSFITAV